ncbi:uncharacterized protein LOC143111275 isoform X2 [Alosa pseudoharengus]|uniref:uncharacterized protein LOC143111275 isoform X2 n=1 Tax=Alosa pseudoharengus TaxID=34774 RepID=UPI003F88850C
MEGRHTSAHVSSANEEAWRKRSRHVSRRRRSNVSQIIEGRSTQGLQPAEEQNEHIAVLEDGFTIRQNVHVIEGRSTQGLQPAEEQNEHITVLEDGFTTRQNVHGPRMQRTKRVCDI